MTSSLREAAFLLVGKALTIRDNNGEQEPSAQGLPPPFVGAKSSSRFNGSSTKQCIASSSRTSVMSVQRGSWQRGLKGKELAGKQYVSFRVERD